MNARKTNPWESFVAFMNRHHISPVEEMKLRDIIKEIIEPPITSEPPRQVSDEEINLMAQKYIKGMAVEPQTESIYYAYYHGASDMRDLLTKNKGETK